MQVMLLQASMHALLAQERLGDHQIPSFCVCLLCAAGRTKASTLSLSVLVAIEMFNAYNALSEDNSLLQLPPWSNPWLTVATFISLGLHCVILYVPFLAQVRWKEVYRRLLLFAWE